MNDDVSVNSLELSIRSQNVLKTKGISTVGQLVKLTKNDLLRIKNCGRRSAREIENQLNEIGLQLGMPDEIYNSIFSSNLNCLDIFMNTKAADIFGEILNKEFNKFCLRLDSIIAKRTADFMQQYRIRVSDFFVENKEAK